MLSYPGAFTFFSMPKSNYPTLGILCMANAIMLQEHFIIFLVNFRIETMSNSPTKVEVLFCCPYRAWYGQVHNNSMPVNLLFLNIKIYFFPDNKYPRYVLIRWRDILTFCVLSSCSDEKIFDLVDLFWLQIH